MGKVQAFCPQQHGGHYLDLTKSDSAMMQIDNTNDTPCRLHSTFVVKSREAKTQIEGHRRWLTWPRDISRKWKSFRSVALTLGCVHQGCTEGLFACPSSRVCESAGLGGPENLHSSQIPRWCWCCYCSADHTLGTISVRDGLLIPKPCLFFLDPTTTARVQQMATAPLAFSLQPL